MFKIEGYFAQQYAERPQHQALTEGDVEAAKQRRNDHKQQVKLRGRVNEYNAEANKHEGTIHKLVRKDQLSAAKMILGMSKTDKAYIENLSDLGIENARLKAANAETDSEGDKEVKALQAKQAEFVAIASPAPQSQGFFARLMG